MHFRFSLSLHFLRHKIIIIIVKLFNFKIKSIYINTNIIQKQHYNIKKKTKFLHYNVYSTNRGRLWDSFTNLPKIWVCDHKQETEISDRHQACNALEFDLNMPTLLRTWAHSHTSHMNMCTIC